MSKPIRGSRAIVALVMGALAIEAFLASCASSPALHFEPGSVSTAPRLTRAIVLEDWPTALALVEAGTGLEERREAEDIRLDPDADPASSATRRLWGPTPLSLAAERGGEALVAALLGTGFYTDADKEMALARAAIARRPDMAAFLVGQGCRVGTLSYPFLALSGDPSCLGLYLKAPVKGWKPPADILHWAVAARDADLLRSFLGLKADPNGAGGASFGTPTSALWAAAAYGQSAMVKALLDAGADADFVDEDSRLSPLMAAAISGDVASARLLVGAGAKLEQLSGDYIYMPMKEGFARTGGAYSWYSSGSFGSRTALMLAAEHGRTEMVKFLLSAGARADTRNEKGNSAMTMAFYGERDEIVAALKDAGAKAPDRGLLDLKRELLLVSVRVSMPATLESYLSELAALYEGDEAFRPLALSVLLAARRYELMEKEHTPAAIMRYNESRSVMARLAAQVALIPARDQDEALRMAVMAPGGILADLYDAGIRGEAGTMLRVADAFARSGDERRYFACLGVYGPLKADGLEVAINAAAVGGNRKIIDYVLGAGAKLDRDVYVLIWNYESTPLGFAANAGNVSSMEYLISKGAKVNPKPGDWINTGFGHYSPLAAACMNGQAAAVKYLVSMGADLELTSYYGTTALAIMAESGDTAIMRILLEAGAKPDARMTIFPNGKGNFPQEKRGETALMRAARAGKAEALRLLLEYGANPRLTDWNGDDALMMAELGGHKEAAKVLREALGDLYR
ncbi:MAG: ankyrin repeat domain-containing protein [Spirochaetes bacterium]|nr:ankyrin repeat domain-containing protein [Spirochaetota bacterium]MBU1079826.1 ankyrin repeat domain-containing protein [Spirochaetota bacterium]